MTHSYVVKISLFFIFTFIVLTASSTRKAEKYEYCSDERNILGMLQTEWGLNLLNVQSSTNTSNLSQYTPEVDFEEQREKANDGRFVSKKVYKRVFEVLDGLEMHNKAIDRLLYDYEQGNQSCKDLILEHIGTIFTHFTDENSYPLTTNIQQLKELKIFLSP